MSISAAYKKPQITDSSFPISVAHIIGEKRKSFIDPHWHEQIEFLLFTDGHASMQCGMKVFDIKKGDFIVINSNEIHSGCKLSETLDFFCIIIDSSIFRSATFDSCEAKYITPIMQHLFLFNNRVSHNDTIKDYIRIILEESEQKNFGFELSIKATVLNILIQLIRNDLNKVLTIPEYNKRNRNLEKINKAIKYIEENYPKDITSDELASQTNFSKYHFCKMFKETTNMTAYEYLNHYRITKAEYLLKTTDMSITEIALTTGFNDINYFCRVFKKHLRLSPSSYKKSDYVHPETTKFNRIPGGKDCGLYE